MKRPAFALLTTALAFAGASAAVAQGPFDLKQTREFFKKLQDGPYMYLQTPRTGLGVGTIFTIVDGTTFFVRRPTECFSAALLDVAAKGDTLRPLTRISLASCAVL